MTATNHALTGAIIGLTVSTPAVALVLALVSHYALDALPHYGRSASQTQVLQSDRFRNYLLLEALVCFGIVVTLAVFQPVNWLLAAVCAFVAASPDLASINRYVTVRKGKRHHPNAYSRFASKIQWFEKPIGGFVEVAYLLGATVLLVKLL